MKSNEALLTIRQNLISWFKKYEYLILPALRFILTLSVLRMLRKVTEYNGPFSNIFVLLGFSILGAFISAEGIVVCAIFLTTIFIFSSNMILGIVVFLALCLIYILYGRLFPKESLLIIAVLVAFDIKIELFVPIVAALFGSYISIVAIIIGIVIWYTLPILMQSLPAISLDKSAVLETINKLLAIDYKGMLVNREMLVMCVIFFIVFTSIYIIRKLDVDYGPYIGIFTGAVMNILGFVMAKVLFSDLPIDILRVILLTILFTLIAVIMQFLSVALDYQRAEIVNFEDDDNYYYVKIIPKIQIAAKKKTVKHVYSNKEQLRAHDEQKESEKFRRMLMEDDDLKF